VNLFHKELYARIYHGDSIAEGLPSDCDLLLVDAPYSDRTHVGSGKVEGVRPHAALPYASWSDDQVLAACNAWIPRTRGWLVSITDHNLAPAWADAMSSNGLYVFAPIPWVAVAGGVRLQGDGPSSWTCWIVVGRPKKKPYSNWGTLPGAYVIPKDRSGIQGSKPLELMRALIQGYSRCGDMVCDPCCGSGSTIKAALDMGRHATGIDVDPEHCKMSIDRLRQQQLFNAEGDHA
jgi:site-specific DNA-methyltransferase (adenine-specific)